MRHLRSLAIAAVVLMISAAVVFAGGGPAWKNPTAEASPSPSVDPLASASPSPVVDPLVAASPSPAVDPLAAPSASPAVTTTTTVACDDQEADDQDGDEQAATEGTETDADGASDAASNAEAACEHPDNHGKAVSEAAHSSPPPGSTEFRNHGAWVSSVARDNHGHSDKTGPAASKTRGGPQNDQGDD